MVDRKSGFWRILKSTLILKTNHEANREIKVDLKSTLILKKTAFAHFEVNLDFKGNLNYPQVKKFSEV